MTRGVRVVLIIEADLDDKGFFSHIQNWGKLLRNKMFSHHGVMGWNVEVKLDSVEEIER